MRGGCDPQTPTQYSLALLAFYLFLSLSPMFISHTESIATHRCCCWHIFFIFSPILSVFDLPLAPAESSKYYSVDTYSKSAPQTFTYAYNIHNFDCSGCGGINVNRRKSNGIRNEWMEKRYTTIIVSKCRKSFTFSSYTRSDNSWKIENFIIK